MSHVNKQFLAKLNRAFGGSLNESALNFPLYSTSQGNAKSTLYGDTGNIAPSPGTYIEWTESQADAVGGYIRCNNCDLDGIPVTIDIGCPTVTYRRYLSWPTRSPDPSRITYLTI